MPCTVRPGRTPTSRRVSRTAAQRLCRPGSITASVASCSGWPCRRTCWTTLSVVMTGSSHGVLLMSGMRSAVSPPPLLPSGVLDLWQGTWRASTCHRSVMTAISPIGPSHHPLHHRPPPTPSPPSCRWHAPTPSPTRRRPRQRALRARPGTRRRGCLRGLSPAVTSMPNSTSASASPTRPAVGGARPAERRQVRPVRDNRWHRGVGRHSRDQRGRTVNRSQDA